MIRVDISIATRRFVIDRAVTSRAASAALKGRVARAIVSIYIVGDSRMRSLNRKQLGHDYVTDVLSTDHGETPEGRLIELILCAPFAARQARAHGVPCKQELARYVIHGCLHCTGYDDRTGKQRAELWREQERVMRNVFGRGYRPATL